MADRPRAVPLAAGARPGRGGGDVPDVQHGDRVRDRRSLRTAEARRAPPRARRSPGHPGTRPGEPRDRRRTPGVRRAIRRVLLRRARRPACPPQTIIPPATSADVPSDHRVRNRAAVFTLVAAFLWATYYPFVLAI